MALIGFLLGFTVIGFFGLYLYILDFSSNFGGLAGFFEVFFSNPLEIRALATEVVSLGFQVSYFSWISVFYCVAYLVLGDARLRPNIFLLILVGGIGFFLNLLFIDRTRPTILFLVCLLSVGIIRFSRMKNPMRFYVSVFAGPLLIFFVQALYTGKYDSEGGLFGNFLAYVLGGFGYFSSLLGDVTPDYSLVRIFYPLSKLMESAGLLDSVPAQILDFREVPFFTNVGTFLEPLLSDGGIWLVIVGVPLLVFSIDLMALRALRDRSIMGLFIWANMVLVALFSFLSQNIMPRKFIVCFYLFCWAIHSVDEIWSRWRVSALRVLVLMRYGRLGASSRLRMVQYIPWLEREDIGVSTQEFFPMRCLIIGIGTVDTVMVR